MSFEPKKAAPAALFMSILLLPLIIMSFAGGGGGGTSFTDQANECVQASNPCLLTDANLTKTGIVNNCTTCTVTFPAAYPTGFVGCTGTVTSSCIHVGAYVMQNVGPGNYQGPNSVFPIISTGAALGTFLLTAFSAATELSSNLRFRMNTNFWGGGTSVTTSGPVRLIANLGSLCPAGTIVDLQYSNNDANFAIFSQDVTVSVSAVDNVGGQISTGATFVPAKVGDVYLSLFVSGGDNLSVCSIDDLYLEIQPVNPTNIGYSVVTYSITRTSFVAKVEGPSVQPTSAQAVIVWIAWWA